MRTPTLMLCAALMAAAGVPLALHAQQAPEVVAAAEKNDAPKKKPVPKVVKPPATPAKELFGAAKTPAPLAAQPSASTPRAALPAARRCPSMVRPGRPCACRAIATGAIPSWSAWCEKLAIEAKAAGRLARTAGRRPLAAARRADADRPRQPSGRPRRRHLAHAHAQPPPHREGARGPVGHLDAGGRQGVGRSRSLEAEPRAPDQARRLLQAGGAHLRAPGHQEGAVRGHRQGQRSRAGCHKVRPMWGHHYHFHVRIVCPPGSSNCEHQPAPGSDDGCGEELRSTGSRS